MSGSYSSFGHQPSVSTAPAVEFTERDYSPLHNFQTSSGLFARGHPSDGIPESILRCHPHRLRLQAQQKQSLYAAEPRYHDWAPRRPASDQPPHGWLSRPGYGQMPSYLARVRAEAEAETGFEREVATLSSASSTARLRSLVPRTVVMPGCCAFGVRLSFHRPGTGLPTPFEPRGRWPPASLDASLSAGLRGSRSGRNLLAPLNP